MDQKGEHYYIDKIIKGDVSSFSYLVDTHKRGAYTLALKIVKNEQDAEEVSQDAFLKVFKNLSKFKREASFSTWLYRIVYNTALSKIKRKKLDTTSIDSQHEQIDSGRTESAYSNLMKEERVKFLTQALDGLPEEDAVLVNLYYTEEKAMGEIAEITGLTHVNVRVKLSRARKKLLTILENVLNKEVKNLV